MSQSDSRFFTSQDAGEEWGTPEWIWKPLSDALNGFDLDPASGAEQTPIAADRYTKVDDGLAQPWYGDVWLNPPYGRSPNPTWAKKVLAEWDAGDVDTITCLVPASMSTNWWQNNYAHGDVFTFIDERVCFHGSGDNSASFASVIVTFGDVPDAYLTACESMGHVLRSI